MPWLPVMILVVFGLVSIGFMSQMPQEKQFTISRLIRGAEPAEPAEPAEHAEHAEHAEPVDPVQPAIEPTVDYGKDGGIERGAKENVKHPYQGVPDKGFEQIYNFIQSKNTALCANVHILKGENSKEPDVHICLDSIRPPCAVYSFGIAYNWIFDDFMIRQGCHVFSFDPSMTLGKHKRHKNHLFEPIGIGPKSGTHTGKSTLYGGKTNYEVLSLQDMMKRYGHNHIDMIRMDVESAEWSVLQQWKQDNLWQHIDQLLLEIHMYGDQNMHANTLMGIPMNLFHTARNLWNNNKLFKDMTQVYEVGLVKKKPLLNDLRYTQLKRITDALERQKVFYYLDGGSVLGAVRVGGIMDHDKDIDIAVINASEMQIEKALEEVNLIWYHNNDGSGPGSTGFGYHIDLQDTKTYVDIWMMSVEGDDVICVGRQNGCKRWINKYNVKLDQKKDVILPIRRLPFGPYQFNFPNKIILYLNKRYNNWRISCGGWQRGSRKCKPGEFEYFNRHYKNHLDKLGQEDGKS